MHVPEESIFTECISSTGTACAVFDHVCLLATVWLDWTMCADTTMGLWMLAFNVTFFEDKRICQPRCHTHAIGFLDNSCQAGCDASQSLRSIHANILCTRDLPNGGPLRYLPSGNGHSSFDAMRVLV